MKNKHYELLEVNNEVVIRNRTAFSLKEIFLYPLPLFILLFLITNIFFATILALLSLAGYLIFRFSAYFYFSEFVINKTTHIISKREFMFNKVIKNEVISHKFSTENPKSEKMERSGQIKYIMYYEHI